MSINRGVTKKKHTEFNHAGLAPKTLSRSGTRHSVRQNDTQPAKPVDVKSYLSDDSMIVYTQTRNHPRLLLPSDKERILRWHKLKHAVLLFLVGKFIRLRELNGTTAEPSARHL